MAPNKGTGGYIELEIPEGQAINVRSSGDPAMIYPINDNQDMAHESVSLRDEGHQGVRKFAFSSPFSDSLRQSGSAPHPRSARKCVWYAWQCVSCEADAFPKAFSPKHLQTCSGKEGLCLSFEWTL